MAVLAALLFTFAEACDVCGGYFGVQPQYDKNFAGLRLRYRNYYGNVNYSQGNTTTNSYSLDLWARFYPVKKVQLLAVAPYMYSKAQNRTGQQVSYGLGDIMILAQYQLFSNVISKSDFTHVLFGGGGVKIPTGRYRTGNDEAPSGSGSIDYLVSFNYVGRFDKLGLNANGSWKVNTQNPDGYRYGNDLNTTMHLFYWVQRKNYNLLPHIGAYFEQIGPDRSYGSVNPHTGSSVWFYSVGTDLYYKNIALNFSFQSPFAEHYVGRQLENYYRIITGITINF